MLITVYSKAKGSVLKDITQKVVLVIYSFSECWKQRVSLEEIMQRFVELKAQVLQLISLAYREHLPKFI